MRQLTVLNSALIIIVLTRTQRIGEKYTVKGKVQGKSRPKAL